MLIVFRASPTPTATAIAPLPPTAAASEAAAVETSIDEVSRAVRLIEAARTPPIPSPSMNALTAMPTVLIELAPAPPRLAPPLPAAVTAADPARTEALIVCVAVAAAVRAPVAVTVEFER